MKKSKIKRRAIKRICAWCGNFMGFKSGIPDKDLSITHGMCESCENEVNERINGA